MTPENFCYWLRGYFELGNDELTSEQIEIIKQHLDLVLTPIIIRTADFPNDTTGAVPVLRPTTYC